MQFSSTSASKESIKFCRIWRAVVQDGKLRRTLTLEKPMAIRSGVESVKCRGIRKNIFTGGSLPFSDVEDES